MADLNQVLTQTNVNGTNTGTGTQQNVGTTTQSNTPYFTQNQLNMQGQAQNLMQQILTGNLQQFGPTQATYDAANAMFQQRQAPKLAAIHGSGSPAINSAMQDLNLQLAGMFSQQAPQQATNLFNAIAQYGFQPTGYNQNSNQNQNLTTNNNTQANQTTTMTDVGGILGSFLSSLGGIF